MGPFGSQMVWKVSLGAGAKGGEEECCVWKNLPGRLGRRGVYDLVPYGGIVPMGFR